MSELQKRIGRIGRRESTAIGFAAPAKERPRAMLLGALASDGASGRAAAEAGADAVIIEAGSAAAAAEQLKALEGSKAVPGALVPSLDEAGADALKAAGCDFVICTLEGTDSAAVDTDRMGCVVVASSQLDDTTLRALAPLGLDGLYVVRQGGAMTLATQLGLVRLSAFAGSPLLVTVSTAATMPEVRALRDSGAVMAIAPSGSTADQLGQLSETLRSIPVPKKGRGSQRDIALVPSLPAAAAEHEHEEEDDGEE